MNSVKRQRIIIMRHGRRADKEGEAWHEQATRAWDPPLSNSGKRDIADVVNDINAILSPDFRIFSSPFRRCVETAELILTHALPMRDLTIDLALSEIYDYLNLFRCVNSSDVVSATGYAGMESWFCKQRIVDIENGAQHARLIGDMSVSGLISTYLKKELYTHLKIVGKFPDFERWVSLPFHTNRRYCEVFEKVADQFDSDAILVTHLAGINSILNQYYGYLHYFYLKPGGFIIFERFKPMNRSCEMTSDQSSSWGPWELVSDCVNIDS